MDSNSTIPQRVVAPKRLHGQRLMAFISGALLELFGAFSIMRVDVWASVLTMLLGFVIIVFALGGQSFSNPYKSWSERLIVVAVCAFGIGILHCVTSIQSLRHLTPSALGSTIAWFIAVSDVSSYLRYCRCNFKAEHERGWQASGLSPFSDDSP